MASLSVLEGHSSKNPHRPREKGAECEPEEGLPPLKAAEIFAEAFQMTDDAEFIARMERQLVDGPQRHPYRALTVVDFTRLLGLARRGVAAEQQGWVERTTGKEPRGRG
jgi:hypothetical protein